MFSDLKNTGIEQLQDIVASMKRTIDEQEIFSSVDRT